MAESECRGAAISGARDEEFEHPIQRSKVYNTPVFTRLNILVFTIETRSKYTE